jgi:hypothetical protein
MHRREFLRVGAVSALGLSLAEALRLRAAMPHARSRACILLWLDGGPSHLDMFDLKPDAPSEVRGPFKPIATKAKGVEICEHMPQLAGLMDKICVLRSVTSPLGEHNLGSHYLLTGYKPSPVLTYPSYGAVVSHLRKGEAAKALPSHIAVPEANLYAGSGYLPGASRPFVIEGDPSKPDFRVRDLDPSADLTAVRLERRRQFLEDLDRLSERIEGSAARAARDAHFTQAYQLLFSKEAKLAFDLTKEGPAVRNRYGMHRLGQSCLMARRLIEAGCGFVTVTDRGWDTHQNIYRELKEGYVGGHAGKLPKLDQALGALLTDLARSGRLDETLIVVMGEFGRTPKFNTVAGRDHWPRVFSVLLAGAGIKGGQAIGTSDSRGESPRDRPITPADLARTVFTALDIAPDHELRTSDGRPVKLAGDGAAIRECF